MKILLSNFPWSTKETYGVRAGSRWPSLYRYEADKQKSYLPFPFFLAYAAAVLKKNNHKVLLIDAIAEGLDDEHFIENVVGYNPDILVVETAFPSFETDMRLARRIKKFNNKIVFILAGPQVSAVAHKILEVNEVVDYVLIGEYENVLSELIEYLVYEKVHEVPLGVAYRENGQIYVMPRRQLTQNLDELPWPERDDLPMDKYSDSFCGLPRPNVQVMASRGCPFACNFCLWPQVFYGDRSYRKRNPQNVIDEVAWLVNKYGFRAVYFDDDVFNIDRTFVFEICREFKKRNFALPWAVMARVDLMDKELLITMAESGLYAVKYGIESADQNVLNLCGKSLNIENAIQVITMTKRAGIKVHLSFCLGLPGETRESIEETKSFIDKVMPDSLQFSFAIPFPGTRLYRELNRKNELQGIPWAAYDGNSCIVDSPHLNTEEYHMIRQDLYQKYGV